MPMLDRTPAAARATAPVEKLARQVVKQRVQAALYFWQRVAKRATPRVSDIHQLRVWSRRAIAAIELFGALLPAEPAADLLRILNKARKRAGQARDCDVLLATLDKPARAILAEPLQALQELRQESAEKLRRAYRKKVRAGDVRECSQALQKKLHPADENGQALPPVQFGPWFQQQFAQWCSAFIKQLRVARPSQRRIHPLRIEGKKVRYALEIGLPSLPKLAGKQLYSSLEQLQQQLGEICDDEALAAQYRKLAQDLKPKPRTKLVEAAESHHQQGQAGFVKFCRWWQAAAGRKKLLRQLTAILLPPEVSALTKPRLQRRKSQ